MFYTFGRVKRQIFTKNVISLFANHFFKCKKQNFLAKTLLYDIIKNAKNNFMRCLMKKFFKEFKEFALRGNVIDLAVGVIIGGAFQTIVKSLVDDLIMPLIGLVTGGVNFADKFIVLKGAGEITKEMAAAMTLTEVRDAGISVFAYGSFITAVLNFVIMAFVIFLFIKFLNNLHKFGKKCSEEITEVITTKICPFCKSEIDVDATRCSHCTSEHKE